MLHRDGKSRIIVNMDVGLITYRGRVASMGTVKDITDRKKAEEQIKNSLEEKEILLREIHHRVKNNLMIVSSLLAHQSQYIRDKDVIDMFTDSQNRILSMALVHEKLYQSKNLAKIDFKEYIDDLVVDLIQSYEVNGNKITLNMNIENIQLDIDFAIPCGLIINELVTNSLKYAFPVGTQTQGEIKIAFHSIDRNENIFELVDSDNGIGLPKDLDFRKTDSLGLHLVTTLAEKQLHGEITLNRSKGTEFKIKFRGIK
jgi:two-component sensor histidine kinase